MNTCALRSEANDAAFQLVAATGLPVVDGCAAMARSGDSNFRQNIGRSGVYRFVQVLEAAARTL